MLGLPPSVFLHLPLSLLLMSLFLLLLLHLLLPSLNAILEVLGFPLKELMFPCISKAVIDINRHSAYASFGLYAGHMRTGYIAVMPADHVVPGLVLPVSHLIKQLIMGVHDGIEELEEFALGTKGDAVVLVLPCQVGVCVLVVLQLSHEIVVHDAIKLMFLDQNSYQEQSFDQGSTGVELSRDANQLYVDGIQGVTAHSYPIIRPALINISFGCLICTKQTNIYEPLHRKVLSPYQQSNLMKIQKYLSSVQHRTKYKKQCLKAKNILFQNDQLQIGCKINPFYDFYSSANYLQINIFIGNKTDRNIDSFKLDFRATPNLQLHIEQKNRSIRERTQYKERAILGCNNYEEEILLLMDFQSSIVTLKSTPIPVTLYNFCHFAPPENLPASIQTQTDLQQLLEHKYEYTEENEMKVGTGIFKKGLKAQIQKYFGFLMKICDGVLMGHFTTSSLVNQYTLVLKVIEDKTLKVSLSSNEYPLFDPIFANLRFLLQS